MAKNASLYIGVGLLWLTYTILTFSTPVNPAATFGLSDIQIQLLRLTLVIPFLLIWLTAVKGAAQLATYSGSITKGADRRPMKNLSKGLYFIAFSTIIASLFGAIENFLPPDNQVGRIIDVIVNYVYVLLPLAGSWFVFQGTQGLLSLVKPSKFHKNLYLTLLPLAALSVVFVWLSTQPTAADSYSLPHWLIFTSINLPSIATWFLGALSTLNVLHVANKISGSIYKSGLRYVALGISAVIAAGIFLQFILVASTNLIDLGLLLILGIIYLFLILQAVGYGLITVGATKLHKIEVT